MIQNAGIIPSPKKACFIEEFITVTPVVYCMEPEWQELADVIIRSAKKIYGLKLQHGEGGIVIVRDESLAPETYRLQAENGVSIFASDYRGACYGAASLLQLIREDGTIQRGKIEDWPDKDYRGLMINFVKYWHPFHTLLNYVDLCFYFKIKYFHLHLTDVQNYTLPSKCFPKLTETGNSYTEEEIRTLRAYARARGVILVPELDLPGHATIFNQVYPEIFSDAKDPVFEGDPTENSRIPSVICAGNPKTYEAILALTDEMLELFPESPYIHLGSDEAQYHAWDHCVHCQQYICDHHLKDSKELYAEFVGRLTDYVLSKGRTPIIWEGFSEENAHHISRDVIVVGWENLYQPSDKLLENGYTLINCAWKPLYIVEYEGKIYHYDDILDWNVYEWRNWLEKSAAYKEPVRVEPTDKVLGAQVCVWSIHYEDGIVRTAENTAAMSERVWTVNDGCTLEAFEAKLQRAMNDLMKLIGEK